MKPVRTSTSLLLLSACFALGPACSRTTAPAREPTPAPDRSVATSPAAPAAWKLDRDRLQGDIAALARDELRGRFTLSPELALAAEFLAARHRELGLLPVTGSSYLVNFPIAVGVQPREPASLQIVRAGKATPVAPADFSITPQTASGEVRGPAVFVGYAAQADPVPAPGEDKPAADAPVYDDLAGLDLKGKIAVVLLDAPGRPDTMAFFRRLRREASEFAAATAPLKQAGDVAGLRALHERTRGRIVAMLQQFLPEADLKDMWPLPDDPLAVELDLAALVGPVMREATRRKGPQFGFQAGSLKSTVERLAQAGAIGVVAVRGPRSFLDAESREADAFLPLQRDDGALGEPLALPIVQMKWKAADRLLRVGKGKKKISELQAVIDTKLIPQSGEIPGVELAIHAAVEPVHVEAPNVLASVPGTDLRDEIVLLGAHYDHIGVDGRGECSESRKDGVVDTICNGADDNASGTAMLLELARHFQAVRPRRTVVFAHFAGEELGLLGSKALADKPPFALDKVVAMINLDMIGRLGPKGLAIGGLVSSDAWMPLLDRVGTAGLSVLYEASVATRSDHASFYRKNIPVLFFFTGTHADYHRPSDHADKINLDGLVKIGEIVHGVARALADGEKVPFRPPPPGGGLSSTLPGTNPDTVVKRVQAAGTIAQ